MGTDRQTDEICTSWAPFRAKTKFLYIGAKAKSLYHLLYLCFCYIPSVYRGHNPSLLHHKAQKYLGLESELLVTDDHDDGLQRPGRQEHPHGHPPHADIMTVKSSSLLILLFICLRSVY